MVKALEKEHHWIAVDINMAIFQKWLDGKGMMPMTWSTLVTVLEKLEHGNATLLNRILYRGKTGVAKGRSRDSIYYLW